MASILERIACMNTDTIKIQIFSKGKQVEYDGRFYFVESVRLRGHDLFVKLEGFDTQVDYRHLRCEPSIYSTKRTSL